GIAAVLHVLAEVLNQLLAALAGIDPAAVEDDRTVQAMAAPEHGPAGEQVRREFTRGRLLVRRALRRRGLRRFVLGRTLRHARVRLLLRQIDADADGLFEERQLAEVRVHEPPVALGEGTERRRLLADSPEDRGAHR